MDVGLRSSALGEHFTTAVQSGVLGGICAVSAVACAAIAGLAVAGVIAMPPVSIAIVGVAVLVSVIVGVACIALAIHQAYKYCQLRDAPNQTYSHTHCEDKRETASLPTKLNLTEMKFEYDEESEPITDKAAFELIVRFKGEVKVVERDWAYQPLLNELGNKAGELMLREGEIRVYQVRGPFIVLIARVCNEYIVGDYDNGKWNNVSKHKNQYITAQAS